MPRVHRLHVGVALAMVGLGCDANRVGPSEPDPTTTALTVVSGDAQVAEVGTELGLPLRIRVTNGGTPVAGVPMVWSDQGAGFITGEPITDREGYASARWTLPTMVGAQRAFVSIGPPTGSARPFTGVRAGGGHAVRIIDVGLLDEGRAQLPGTMLSHRFDQPGTYAFVCPLHAHEANDGGTVIVTP